MASICCSPPDSVPPFCVTRSWSRVYDAPSVLQTCLEKLQDRLPRTRDDPLGVMLVEQHGADLVPPAVVLPDALASQVAAHYLKQRLEEADERAEYDASAAEVVELMGKLGLLRH